jgi:hypothetical protein
MQKKLYMYYGSSCLILSVLNTEIHLLCFQEVTLTVSSRSASLRLYRIQGIIVFQEHHSHVDISEVLVNANRQTCKLYLLQHLLKLGIGHLQGKICVLFMFGEYLP